MFDSVSVSTVVDKNLSIKIQEVPGTWMDTEGIHINSSREGGSAEHLHLYMRPAQLRDLHAKIGARLAEIDAQQPVVDIEGEIECPF